MANYPGILSSSYRIPLSLRTDLCATSPHPRLPTPRRENPHVAIYHLFACSAEWLQSRITSSGLVGDPRPRLDADADQQFLVENSNSKWQYYFVFACALLQTESRDSST